MTLLISLFAIKLLAQLSILNITTKLQKLYSPPKNSRVDNKLPVLFKKNLVAWAIFCMSWRYWLKYLLHAICQKSGEASFWEMMDTFILLAYESLATSGTLLHQWIACQDFTLNSEDVSFFVQAKKVISMNYGYSTNSWKPWRCVRLDLVLTVRVIYINCKLSPLGKVPNNSKRTQFKDILPWKVS